MWRDMATAVVEPSHSSFETSTFIALAVHQCSKFLLSQKVYIAPRLPFSAQDSLFCVLSLTLQIFACRVIVLLLMFLTVLYTSH